MKDCELDYFGLSDVDRETLMTITALDTGTTDLLAALDEGVLTLTLNRPEARNAMSRAMNHALARQLAVAALEPNVRCVVLTGAGKGFCAGGDVKAMAASADGTVGEATIDEAIYRQRVNQRETAGALFQMPKPTLAAPRAGRRRGAVVGAGLRPAHHGQHRHHDDRLRPRRFFRRLWRNLFHDAACRRRESARAVFSL